MSVGRHTGGASMVIEPQYADPYADPAVAAVNTETKAASTGRKHPSGFYQVIGILGELLITVGIVIGMYVAWDLWFTGIGAGDAEDAAMAELSQHWKKSPAVIGTPRTDAPPAVNKSALEGDPIGMIYIPRFGDDYVATIRQGIGTKTVLNKGAFGHYPTTEWPGEVGNFATAAHRSSYGSRMYHVPDLKNGDAIVVATKDAWLVYQVSDSYIVKPTQWQVTLPVPNQPGKQATERMLTITACDPPFSSENRWIIHATFAHWVPRSEGIPVELKNSTVLDVQEGSV